MVSPKLPELAGVIVEASAWSLVVFICPDSPFSQGSGPPPEREQGELGGRSCGSKKRRGKSAQARLLELLFTNLPIFPVRA